ncbi:MAG: MFS transporter, partial [Elusimicrobia bacterium]|nr:MFS transporter [Elusimicrobiota bacterium]
ASLWSGSLVDRREKRFLLASSLSGLIVFSLGLAAVSCCRRPSVLALFSLIGVAALCESLEQPAASSYLQMIVPRELFPKAAAWNLTSYVGPTILGPVIAGALIPRIGPGGVYLVAAFSLLVSLVLAATLRRIPPTATAGVSTFRSAVEGLSFVRSRPIIFSAMVLDCVAVLFGEVVFILPVFAEKLGVGPLGLGFMRAAPAVGSCIVSILQARSPRIRIRWDGLLRAVTIFGVCVLTFAVSPWFPLSLVMLLCGGAADGVSVIIRQSLYQANTPDAFRGRVSSVSGVFISLSNEVGGFESGFAAQLVGAVPSVLFGGAVTLLTVAVMKWKYPRLDDEVSHAT